MGLSITEKQDCISVAEMRRLFEAAVKATSTLQRNSDLAPCEKDGAFDGYIDQFTDSLWAGFALGLRLAERSVKGNQAIFPCQKRR